MSKADTSALDGNAAAGAFGAVFAEEVTTAIVTCRTCGRGAALGAQDAYVRGPGVTLRCSGCSGVLARVVNTASETWLELRGSTSWRFPADSSRDAASPTAQRR